MPERLSPQEWVKVNEQEIHTLLLGFSVLLVGLLRTRNPDSNTLFFDLQRRSLSEMPLCQGHRVVAGKLKLPQGYTITRGFVDTQGEICGNRSECLHYFFANNQGEVLDLTAAQFVRGGKEKGDRSEKLKQLAPNLVEIHPSGLTVLHGSIDEIAKETKIVYLA